MGDNYRRTRDMARESEEVKASEEKRNTTWVERRQQRKDRENSAPVLPSDSTLYHVQHIDPYSGN